MGPSNPEYWQPPPSQERLRDFVGVLRRHLAEHTSAHRFCVPQSKAMISWQRQGDSFTLDRSTHAPRGTGPYRVERRRVIIRPSLHPGEWGAFGLSVQYGWSSEGCTSEAGLTESCTDEDISRLLEGPEQGFKIPTATEQEKFLYHLRTLLQLPPLHPITSVTQGQRSDQWHGTAALPDGRECNMDYIALSDFQSEHLLQESATAELVTWLHDDGATRMAHVTRYAFLYWPSLPPDMQAVHVQDFPRREVWADGKWHRQTLERQEPDPYRCYQVCRQREFLNMLQILPLHV